MNLATTNLAPTKQAIGLRFNKDPVKIEVNY
jgi:hypothetical protein